MIDTVRIDDVEVIGDSGKALLVNSEVWKRDDTGTLIITRWIAEKKGLG